MSGFTGSCKLGTVIIDAIHAAHEITVDLGDFEGLIAKGDQIPFFQSGNQLCIAVSDGITGNCQ